jgi:hypothetical protein
MNDILSAAEIDPVDRAIEEVFGLQNAAAPADDQEDLTDSPTQQTEV